MFGARGAAASRRLGAAMSARPILSGVLLQAAVTGAGEDRVRLEQEERLGRADVADAERGEHVLEAVGCHLDGHVVKRGGDTGEVVDA